MLCQKISTKKKEANIERRHEQKIHQGKAYFALEISSARLIIFAGILKYWWEKIFFPFRFLSLLFFLLTFAPVYCKRYIKRQMLKYILFELCWFDVFFCGKVPVSEFWWLWVRWFARKNECMWTWTMFD